MSIKKVYVVHDFYKDHHHGELFFSSKEKAEETLAKYGFTDVEEPWSRVEYYQDVDDGTLLDDDFISDNY